VVRGTIALHPVGMPRVLAVAAALAIAACSSAPTTFADGVGAGVTRADRDPPPNATPWTRPTWRVGDRFEMVRGGGQRGVFTVVEATPEHYALDLGNGYRARRDLDLGHLGEWHDAGAPMRVLTPADTRYHWPLWVGKTWSCEFVDRMRGGAAMRMIADYTVEDLDSITVAAGTFPALRIARTLRVPQAADGLVRWQVTWYSPELGIELRQQHGDTLVELAAKTPAP
jgi:hypothetical protein